MVGNQSDTGAVEHPVGSGLPENVRTLELVLTPADFSRLPNRDLSGTICVVFDVLRATSTMLRAFANGAQAIRPASDIPKALAWYREWPDALLAGERDGLRIGADRTHGVEFHLGNSPREFTRTAVNGRRIIMTTTNGTRALRACQGAAQTWVASFGNLAAIREGLLSSPKSSWILVCSGTYESLAYEDILGAGALIDRLSDPSLRIEWDDGSHLARQAFQLGRNDLLRALGSSRNGRRLLNSSELAGDVPVCLEVDTVDFVPALHHDGVIRRLS